MNIVLLTLAVVCGLCGIAVALLTVHAGVCRVLEPELLMFDKPLTEGIDFEREEAAEAKA